MDINREYKAINMNFLTKFVGKEKTAICEIIDLILKQIPEDLTELEAAIVKIDYHAIRSVAHRMKSTIFLINNKGLNTILEEMEALGELKNEIKKIEILNRILYTICNEALQELALEKINQLKK